MALVYYETGIKVPAAGGDGFDYVNVLVTQKEDEARTAYQADRRNYLVRLSFGDDGTHTEFWDPKAGCWESAPPSDH